MSDPPPVKRRRANAKSRGGCSRCKAQHLKCDEGKPQCGRCVRLGIECPGYETKLKWLTKHQPDGRSPASGSRTPVPQIPGEGIIQPIGGVFQELDWMETATPALTMGIREPTVTTTLDGGEQQSLEETALSIPLTPPWPDLPQLNDFSWDPNCLLQDNSNNDNDAAEVQLLPTTSKRKPMMLESLQSNPQELIPRVQGSLTHQSTELISYYFKEVTKLYAVYDDHRNPFRSVVSNLYSHSQAINLAAQSMAAACLVEIHPRFDYIGRKLRAEAMQLIRREVTLDHRALMALMMFGPTGNWHNASDLGIGFYALMRDRIDSMAASGELAVHEKNINSFNFFREAMVHWEMLLAFVADSNTIRPCDTPIGPVIQWQAKKQIAHPWTGIARDAVQLVANVGRLVRSHRIRHQTQQFVTQAYIAQMERDVVTARDLEAQLLAYQHPDAESILVPDDPATPVWHLTTLAEIYRYAGLLQIYRVFPDVLADRLRAEDSTNSLTIPNDTSSTVSEERRNRWLTAFSVEALRLLETMPLSSGTRDFQPFLLVVLSSELACERSLNTSSDLPPAFDEISEDSVSTDFIEIAMVRNFVSDRLTDCLRLIPPKPIRFCLDIVKESWRRIDEGQKDVYWLDVMIQNGWETIMA